MAKKTHRVRIKMTFEVEVSQELYDRITNPEPTNMTTNQSHYWYGGGYAH